MYTYRGVCLFPFSLECFRRVSESIPGRALLRCDMEATSPQIVSLVEDNEEQEDKEDPLVPTEQVLTVLLCGADNE